MLAHFGGHFVRVGRIELPTPAWEAEVLPLNYTRIFQLYTFTFDESNPRIIKWIAPSIRNPLSVHGPASRSLCDIAAAHSRENAVHFLIRSCPTLASEAYILPLNYTSELP